MFHYNEPVNQIGLRFAMIPRSQIKLSPYQRDTAPTLLSSLAASMHEGFLVPIIVVQINDSLYECPDGQHRLESADKNCSGDYLVPSVIVPYYFKERFLMFNIEKADDIRAQATKVYNFYIDKTKEQPDKKESDFAISFGYMSYIISIAFAFREDAIDSPSLIESPCKKLDNKSFLNEPLASAIEIRRQRGHLVRDLNALVQSVAFNYGISDFNLKKAIISKASQKLWGGKRSIDDSFENGIRLLMGQIDSMDWSWMAGR